MLTFPCDQPLWRSWFSFMSLPALAYACERLVFDLLQKAPLSAHELACHLQTKLEASEDWLDLLVIDGFLTKEKGCYALSSVAERYLVSNSSHYWGAALSYSYQAIKRHCPIKSALDREKKPQLWQKLNRSVEQQNAFTKAMDAHVSFIASEFVRDERLKKSSHLMEWGAGSGRLARELLNAFPELSMTLVDFEGAARSAQEQFDFAPYGPRLKWLYGNVSELTWPKLVDGIVMSHFTHHCSYDVFKGLLERAKAKLKPGSPLYILDLFKTQTLVFEVSAFSLHLSHTADRSLWKLEELLQLLQVCGYTIQSCDRLGPLHHQITAF